MSALTGMSEDVSGCMARLDMSGMSGMPGDQQECIGMSGDV